MYVDAKLTRNIKVSILSRLNSVPGLSDSQRVLLAREVLDGIAEALKETDEERLLKEKAGHPMWDTLHYIARVADDENNPQIYLDQLNVYMRGHPCKEECRPHLVRNIQRLNPSNYTSMFAHSVDLHNLVNIQLKKPRVSLADAESIYDLDCDSCIFAPSGKSQSSNSSNGNGDSSSVEHSTSRAGVANSARVYPLRRGAAHSQ